MTPPYAAPNPPRRKGCGGCAGAFAAGCLLLLVAIAIGGFFLVRTGKRWIENPPIPPMTQQEAAAILPQGIPLYPGLKLAGKQSALLNSGNVRFDINGLPRATHQQWVSYQCAEGIEPVAAWYRAKLPKLGWKPDGSARGIVCFRKGDVVFTAAGAGPGFGPLPVLKGHIYLMRGTAKGTWVR
ncbi:MAG TPA: hypothetical protein VGM37_03780 [Armatimonadota bacterium]